MSDGTMQRVAPSVAAPLSQLHGVAVAVVTDAARTGSAGGEAETAERSRSKAAAVSSDPTATSIVAPHTPVHCTAPCASLTCGVRHGDLD